MSPLKHKDKHKDDIKASGINDRQNLLGDKMITMAPDPNSTCVTLAWLPIIITKNQAAMLQTQDMVQYQDRLDLQSSEMIRKAVIKFVLDKCYCKIATSMGNPEGFSDCICKLHFTQQLECYVNNGYHMF